MQSGRRGEARTATGVMKATDRWKGWVSSSFPTGNHLKPTLKSWDVVGEGGCFSLTRRMSYEKER